MLVLEASSDMRQRAILIGATERGLALRIDGRSETAAWSKVVEVSAGKVLLDRGSGIGILVLVIAIDLGGETRLVVISEVEAAWPALTDVLPIVLPGIASFDDWGAALVANDEPAQLYRRAEDWQ